MDIFLLDKLVLSLFANLGAEQLFKICLGSFIATCGWSGYNKSKKVKK